MGKIFKTSEFAAHHYLESFSFLIYSNSYAVVAQMDRAQDS